MNRIENWFLKWYAPGRTIYWPLIRFDLGESTDMDTMRGLPHRGYTAYGGYPIELTLCVLECLLCPVCLDLSLFSELALVDDPGVWRGGREELLCFCSVWSCLAGLWALWHSLCFGISSGLVLVPSVSSWEYCLWGYLSEAAPRLSALEGWRGGGAGGLVRFLSW